MKHPLSSKQWWGAPKKFSTENRYRKISWLELFYATIDERFEGVIADDAKKRAALMADMFLTRLQQLNGNNDRVIF